MLYETSVVSLFARPGAHTTQCSWLCHSRTNIYPYSCITIANTCSQIFEQNSVIQITMSYFESGNLENIIEMCITEKMERQIKIEKPQPEITCM